MIECFLDALIRDGRIMQTNLGQIMYKNKAWRLTSACIAMQAIAAMATIATAASAQEPPRLEKLEEGGAPAVTIRQPDSKARVEEKRAPGGKVTEIRVKSGGSTYVVKPNEAAGSAAPGDLQSNAIRPAQWEVGEFDLGRQAAKEQEDAGTAAVPAPPEAAGQPAGK